MIAMKVISGVVKDRIVVEELPDGFVVDNGQGIGEVYDVNFLPFVPLKYIAARQAAYPTIPEQLDTIYWDKINGTNIWAESISAIKTKYPKP